MTIMSVIMITKKDIATVMNKRPVGSFSLLTKSTGFSFWMVFGKI